MTAQSLVNTHSPARAAASLPRAPGLLGLPLTHPCISFPQVTDAEMCPEDTSAGCIPEKWRATPTKHGQIQPARARRQTELLQTPAGGHSQPCAHPRPHSQHPDPPKHRGKDTVLRAAAHTETQKYSSRHLLPLLPPRLRFLCKTFLMLAKEQPLLESAGLMVIWEVFQDTHTLMWRAQQMGTCRDCSSEMFAVQVMEREHRNPNFPAAGGLGAQPLTPCPCPISGSQQLPFGPSWREPTLNSLQVLVPTQAWHRTSTRTTALPHN